MSHTCSSCGTVADNPEQLCSPEKVVLTCEHCGKEDVSASHVCKEKLNAMSHSCTTCGKVSDTEEGLCSPREIH